MKYEYNGHLLFEERIDLVSKEIIKKYPEISMEKAKLIASLEKPITTEVNDEIKFQRLFNILFFAQNDEKIFDKVLKDITVLYKQMSKTEKIDDIMMGLINYKNNQGPFPEL